MQPSLLSSWEEAVAELKRQPHLDALVRACYFDDPLLAAAERYRQSTEWLAVRSLIGEPTGSALDIGAGRGISSYALARDGWNVTALEPDPSHLVGAGAIRALAIEADLPIEVVQSRGEDLPFEDSTFDLVHCRQVLHHAADLGRLCSQVARVLKPDGMLIATREHVISRQEDLPAFLDSHPLHRIYGGEHAYLLQDYRNALQRAGLRISRVMNPLETAINFYPSTLEELKTRMAAKLRFPFPRLIPGAALALAGRWINTPGRLFSFVARKPTHD